MENLILLLVFIFCLSFVFTVGALCEVLLSKPKDKGKTFFDYKL